MKQKKALSTKYEILLCATQLFLEKGYTDTYVTTIANVLNISTGNLTFHFPTKEHILTELIKEMFKYQWEMEEEELIGEHYLVSAYLLELAIMASVCVENPNIQDLIVAAYTLSMPTTIIRTNDAERAKSVFGEFSSNWKEMDYVLAEDVVFGIECALFRTVNADELSFEQRVAGFMDAILKIYEVPESTRQSIIAKVMAVDYRSKGSRLFENFYSHVKEKSAQELQRVEK